MSEWLPIKTAPRDGALKLFYSPAGGVFIAPDTEPEPLSSEQQAKIVLAGGEWPNKKWLPTHWMPLPTPPQSSASGLSQE